MARRLQRELNRAMPPTSVAGYLPGDHRPYRPAGYSYPQSQAYSMPSPQLSVENSFLSKFDVEGRIQ